MNRLLFVACVLLIFGNICDGQQYAGIRINVTVPALNEIQAIAEPFVTHYIEAMEPIHVPPVSKDLPLDVGQVNFTDMSIFDTSHTGFTYQILPGQGLQLTLSGFAARMNYTLVYDLDLIGTGTYSSQAVVNQTTITLLFAFNATAEGQPSVELASNVLDVEYLSTGIAEDSIFHYIIDMLNPLFEYIIDDDVPSAITPIVNDDLSDYLSNLTMQTYMDPQNLTVLQYTLAGAPMLEAGGIVIDLTGNAYAVGVTTGCDFPSAPIPNLEKRDVRVFLNDRLFECVLQAFTDSGIINNMANGMLDQFLNLGNRVQYGITLIDGSTVTLDENGAVVVITMQVWLNTLVSNAYQRILTIDTDITANMQLSVDVNPPNISASAQVITATTSFGTVTPGFDFPSVYQQEILQTNFTQLALRADALLASQVVPKINAQLKGGFAFASNMTNYLLNPSVGFFDGVLFIGGDINTNIIPASSKTDTEQ